MQSDSPRVLFVCLGNICRSPMAEAAFRLAASEAGLRVHADSAGTGGWHIGKPPDPRACTVARRHGVDISGMRARQVDRADFDRFDHIVAMDGHNLAELQVMAPKTSTAQVSLLLDHAPGRVGESVADPYYGDADGFATTWADVVTGTRGLVAELAAP